MKDTRVHLNTNGNSPVEEDTLVMQEIMRMIAGMKSAEGAGMGPRAQVGSSG